MGPSIANRRALHWPCQLRFCCASRTCRSCARRWPGLPLWPRRGCLRTEVLVVIALPAFRGLPASGLLSGLAARRSDRRACAGRQRLLKAALQRSRDPVQFSAARTSNGRTPAACLSLARTYVWIASWMTLQVMLRRDCRAHPIWRHALGRSLGRSFGQSLARLLHRLL